MVISHPSEVAAYRSAGLVRCYMCYTYKEASCFCRSSYSRNGFNSRCKDCERIRRQTPEGRARNIRARHRRRRTEKGTQATLTAQEWANLLEEYNHSCYICGSAFNEGQKVTRDHILPVSRGGGLTVNNIAPACLSCNSRKGARTPEECSFSFAQYNIYRD